MVRAELSYNPYLLETIVTFNGQNPKINSLVEKYKDGKLQVWLSKIPDIFYNEMNGYNFELHFTGTKLDFNDLQIEFQKALQTQNQPEDAVKIFHRNELASVGEKDKEITNLLDWLADNKNRKFDNFAFREENESLFDEEYIYISLQGNPSDIKSFSGKDISVENVDEVSQLPIDISKIPIIYYIYEDNTLKLRKFLKSILARDEVIQTQLFFIVNPELNPDKIKRTIKDLGIDKPQLINSIEDPELEKYFELFPMTDYVYNSISVFRKVTDDIRAELELEKKKHKQNNIAIHEELDKLNRVISKLKKSDLHFKQMDNLEETLDFDKVREKFIEKVQNWRKRRTNINGDLEADKIMEAFNCDLEKYFTDFIDSLESIFVRVSNELYGRCASIYKEAEYYDVFSPDSENYIDLSDYSMPDLKKAFKNYRKEEFVPKDDFFDILNPFASKEVYDSIEMVQRVSYKYQEFRDEAETQFNGIAEDIISKIARDLENYYNYTAQQYMAHLEELIKEHTDKKNAIENQLSKDEQELQRDFEWLTEFVDKLEFIERG